MANKKCIDCGEFTDAGATKSYPKENLCFECLIDRLHLNAIRRTKKKD